MLLTTSVDWKSVPGTYSLLEVGQFHRSKGVSLSNDRNDIDSGAQASHQLDINLSQAGDTREQLNET